ncbi:MAG TPA: hypothetical protein V6D02_14595 [Candidatus Obscuribacterales bacterium]
MTATGAALGDWQPFIAASSQPRTGNFDPRSAPEERSPRPWPPLAPFDNR